MLPLGHQYCHTARIDNRWLNGTSWAVVTKLVDVTCDDLYVQACAFFCWMIDVFRVATRRKPKSVPDIETTPHPCSCSAPPY